MTETDKNFSYKRRIYPLDPRKLTEEQMAVTFAMTSRSPDAFDAIAARVSEEKAADFNERWVLNYGHASVAEHAVLHMAVENISRLACDIVEDNRLASYTEKSSRYQVIDAGAYHVPAELDGHPLRNTYVECCDALFDAYARLVDGLMSHLRTVTPRREDERDRAYDMRLRRVATDSARFLLPAATLTNVGLTINARGLEHAVRKLLSTELREAREVGEEIKSEAQKITPTLIKYADRNEYLALTEKDRRDSANDSPVRQAMPGGTTTENGLRAELVHSTELAEQRLVAALLYKFSDRPYGEVWRHTLSLDRQGLEGAVRQALERLGLHDVPVRELESVDYVFDLVMDYGAYREFKRHRMQTYLPQSLTVDLGYVTPPLVKDAGLTGLYAAAIAQSDAAFRAITDDMPHVAEYVVTHGHKRRVLSKMNLRECYHLFKLRTQPTAHFTLREVMNAALEQAKARHPLLFAYLKLRS